MNRHQASRLIESLFGDWGPSLVRYAYRLTSDREAADDLVQESFMALYQAYCRGAEVENPRAWTLSVVRHLAAKRLRDQARRKETLMPMEALESVPDLGTVRADGTEEDVVDLFIVLSKREEEVELMRLESRKYREIARTLGISQKTVETLLARALKKLRKTGLTRKQGSLAPAHLERHVPKTLQ